MRPLLTIVAPNRGPFTLDGTRTYVVGTSRVAIIDPGPDSDEHVRAVAREVSGAQEASILVTHDHSDHSAASEALARLIGAPVFGPVDGATELAPGEVVETDAGDLTVVPTPGHAAPHLSLHWREQDAVFVGDLLLGKGDTTWLGAYPGCIRDYLESLDRLESLGAGVLYPAHGPPIFDVSGAVARYRNHRLERLDQLFHIRRAEPAADIEELTRKLYGMREGTRLHRAGLRSVEAMLHHLAVQGSDGYHS